jgi:hypothetical protein
MARTTDIGEHSSTWWARKGDAAARALWGWIDRLKARHRTENLIDLIHEAIYEGRPLTALSDNPGAEYLRRQNSKSAPANLNITRSMVDTVTSKLGKRRPMPVISADDAGWSQKLAAKRASRVLRRKLGQPSVERSLPLVLRDAVIRGTGCAKVVRDGGDVSVERVPKEEIVVDPREARYGAPRSMAQVKSIAREVLLEAFPDAKHRELIKNAGRNRDAAWDPIDAELAVDADQVQVVEAWHLPSGPSAKDGRHIISVRGGVLLEEKWTRPRFPICVMHWSAPMRGFWGHGLVEDLTGIQAKVNDLARDIQESLYYGASLKVFLPRTSGVNKHHLRARHPVVIEYDGAPPNFVSPNPVSQQQVQFLEWLINKAFEISGISQLSASSKNPLGANASGKALDTMEDIESDRFSHVQLGYAMFRCDLGQAIVDEARCIATDADLKPKERAAWIREIEWKEFDVDEGDYHLVMEPINFLPESRAGRLSYVGEMAQNGLLPKGPETLALFDEPDINRANRHLLGPYRALEKQMELVADVDVPLSDCLPDPHMDFEYGIIMAKGELNDSIATSRVTDEEALEVQERYRRWISHAEGLRKKKLKADAAAQGAPGMAGPVPGGPAPAPGPAGMPPPDMAMAAGAPGMAA